RARQDGSGPARAVPDRLRPEARRRRQRPRRGRRALRHQVPRPDDGPLEGDVGHDPADRRAEQAAARGQDHPDPEERPPGLTEDIHDEVHDADAAAPLVRDPTMTPRALRRRKKRAKERGIALIMVLGAIAVLTVMLAEMQDSTGAELASAM